MNLRGCLTVALLGATVLPVSVAADLPVPYRIWVTAEYGDPLGPESLRDVLERELIARLRVAGCFAAVDPHPSDSTGRADLIVKVILDRFDESTEYDVSIATQHRPDSDPETRRQWTANVEAVIHIQVWRASDRALVKMERSHAAASRRAQPGEDTHHAAYGSLVDIVVRKTRSYLCKPSSKKWEKQIREAREVGQPPGLRDSAD